ncbi:MAG: aminoglycoside phosphotransferase family protein [Acidimicrobiales bacterium]
MGRSACSPTIPAATLLLERCERGRPLPPPASPTLSPFVDLLPRLWVAPPVALRTLADEARVWRASMPGAWERAGRPCERRLVDAACSLIDELLGDGDHQPGDHVLVHQDLHAENVLAAGRRPWLAIDPKPLASERAFACAPIVRDPDLGHGKADVLGRLDRLTSELGLDRERARAWTVVQTTAWSFTSSFAAQHHQTVRWLLEGC